MIAAHLVDPRPGQQVEVGVAVSTPTGLWVAPSVSDHLHIEVAAEYLLITLRDLPLPEEGIYGFQIHLGDEIATVVSIPVLAFPIERQDEVH